jgi:hypothetical protein
MSNKDNGGPVFPFEYHNQTRSYQPGFFNTGMLAPDASQQFAGMNLRDHIAIHATEDDIRTHQWKRTGRYSKACTMSREQARYAHADAMLLERAK